MLLHVVFNGKETENEFVVVVRKIRKLLPVENIVLMNWFRSILNYWFCIIFMAISSSVCVNMEPP